MLMKKEKYATGPNKKLYFIVPSNHPEYKFPYNLEDQVNNLKKAHNVEKVEESGTKYNKVYTLYSKDFKDGKLIVK